MIAAINNTLNKKQDHILSLNLITIIAVTHTKLNKPITMEENSPARARNSSFDLRASPKVYFSP